MKVSELIELLKAEDPDRLVVLYQDHFGDANFIPLAKVERAAYYEYDKQLQEDTGLLGSAVEDGTEAIAGEDEDEEDIKTAPAVLLYPKGIESA